PQRRLYGPRCAPVGLVETDRPRARPARARPSGRARPPGRRKREIELWGAAEGLLPDSPVEWGATVSGSYLKKLRALRSQKGILEAPSNPPVRATFQLLDYDAKRMHFFEQLFHASEGWVAATSENMSLHVDMTAGKTTPFPDDVARGLARMKASHPNLPRPEA